MNPRSRIRLSATLRASRDAVLSPQGESLFGLLISPAAVSRIPREVSGARRFAKITAGKPLRRRIHPPPEIDAVEIQLHDLLLAEALLDSAGKKDLEQLAPERLFL